MSSAVQDVDRGLEKVFRVSKKSQREIAVGIFVRRILDYAFVIEAQFHFLREGTEAVEKEFQQGLTALHDMLASGKGNIRQAQLDLGEVIAEGIRASIKEKKLIKSGDMLASVTVKERDVK